MADEHLLPAIIMLTEVAESLEVIEARCRQIDEHTTADLVMRVSAAVELTGDRLNHLLYAMMEPDPDIDSEALPGELRLATQDGIKVDTPQSD